MSLFIMESTDFTNVKLSIYEKFDNNEISESEKDTLLEAIQNREFVEAYTEKVSMDTVSTMAKVVGIAASGVAVAGAMIALIAKVVSMLRVKDKIKGSEELTKINNDLKKCLTSLKESKFELNKIIVEYSTEISDAESRSDFYGSRITTHTSYGRTEDGKSVTVHNTELNPQYDKKKATEEKENAEKLRQIVSKYIKKRDELRGQISELKALKSRFMSVVRTNLTPEETEKVRKELDGIMESLDIKSEE